MPHNIIGIILQHCLISSVILYPFNARTTCLYSPSLASPLPSDKHKHSRENACLSPRDRLCSGIFPSPLEHTQVSAAVPARFNNYKPNTIFSRNIYIYILPQTFEIIYILLNVVIFFSKHYVLNTVYYLFCSQYSRKENKKNCI